MAKTKPISPQEATNLVNYLSWHSQMESLPNDQLARLFLRSAPLMGRHAELCVLMAERLVPGIVDKMADESEKRELPLEPVDWTAPAKAPAVAPAQWGGRGVMDCPKIT